ncbi:MAG: hypothetical protein U0935_24450 [Pirellulales bacterium]
MFSPSRFLRSALSRATTRQRRQRRQRHLRRRAGGWGIETLETRAVPAALVFQAGPIHDLTLQREGADFVVVQTSNPANVLASQAVAATTNIQIQGVDGVTDILTIDHSGGTLSVPVAFTGGVGGGDRLLLTGKSFSQVVHQFGGVGVETISQDGHLIAVAGVEAVKDQLGAGQRIFHLPGSSDSIELGTGFQVADGISRIDVATAGPLVDFVAPQQTLIFDSGDGDDHWSVGPLDLAGTTATVSLQGGAGDDQFQVAMQDSVSNTLTIDGGTGQANSAQVKDTQILGASDDGLFATNLESLVVADSQWNHNRGHGMVLTQVQSVSLDNVTADENYLGGLLIDNGDSAQVSGGSFSNNLGHGISMSELSGTIELIGVTANYNQRGGAGVSLKRVGSYFDAKGHYQHNADGGIVVAGVVRDVTLVRTIAEDNDEDKDGVGAGFQARSLTGKSDSPRPDELATAIGGNLLIQGGRYRRTNPYAANQVRGIHGDAIGGSVTIEDAEDDVIDVTGHPFQGVWIESAQGEVTFRGGEFSANGGTNIDLGTIASAVIAEGVSATYGSAGLRVGTAASFTDTSGEYSNNVGHGVEIVHVLGDVTLQGTVADNNGADGIHAVETNAGSAYGGALVVGQAHVSGNAIYGLLVQGGGVTATLSDSQFNDNGATNVALRFVSGPLVFDHVEATGSKGMYGVQIHAGWSTLFQDTAGNYSHNAFSGMRFSEVGTVSLTRTVVDGNGGHGIDAWDHIGGDLLVSGGKFRDNAGDGVYVEATQGMAKLGYSGFVSTEVTGNQGRGLNLGYVKDQVKLIGGDYSNNGGTNIWVNTTPGAVTLSGVTASNGVAGVRVGDAASVQLHSSTIDNNAGIGVELFDDSPVANATATVSNTHVAGNSIGLQVRGDVQTMVQLQGSTVTGNTQSNSSVSGQSGIGIAVLGGAVTVSDSHVTNNVVGALLAEADGFLQLTTSELAGNLSAGVVNWTATPVDAVRNYWGAATGPTNAANPGGTGDKVTGVVEFAPWATTVACDVTATPRIIKGSLVIGGTENADTVAVDAVGTKYVVTLNGVSYSFQAAQVTDHIVIYVFGGSDTVTVSVSKRAEIHGGRGDDNLTGGSGDDVLWGDEGQDNLWGGAGHDVLSGGQGIDSLVGNAGKDILLGGAFKTGLMHQGIEAYNYATLKSISQAWSGAGVLDADLATLVDDVFDSEQDSLTGGLDADWYLGNISGGGSPFDTLIGFLAAADKKSSL